MTTRGTFPDVHFHNMTVDADITVSSGVAAKPLLSLTNTETTTASSTELRLIKDAANVAAGEQLGKITFYGDDATPAQQSYANIIVTAPNVTATTENGKIAFQVASGGGAAVEGLSVAGSETATKTATTDTIVKVPGTLSVGGKKFTSFIGTLASTNAVATAYSDNDVLVELGTLDISLPSGFDTTARRILIEKVIVVVEVAAGSALVGHIDASATTGTATNSAISTPTELFGLGATQLSPEGYQLATTATEADDLNFNSAGTYWCAPNIQLDSTLIYIYASTTTAVNADITAGRFNVMIEYTVL